MEDLVLIMNNKAVCTSLQVAEKFRKRHDRVLRAIDDLKIYSPQNWGKSFTESTYKDSSGKTNKMYYMNRDGFTIVAMGFTGKSAIEWKWKYINAFNAMEEILKERSTPLWTTAREKGKIARNEETNILKDLVEYARRQDFTKEDRLLYMNYSKLANKICGVSNRDNATAEQLTNLTVVENIILRCVQDGISQEKYYKDIYQDCKNRLEMFSDIAYLKAAN